MGFFLGGGWVWLVVLGLFFDSSESMLIVSCRTDLRHNNIIIQLQVFVGVLKIGRKMILFNTYDKSQLRSDGCLGGH
jgi:hypothetical protein